MASCCGEAAVAVGAEDLVDVRWSLPGDSVDPPGEPDNADCGCYILDPIGDSPVSGTTVAGESISDWVLSPAGEHMRYPPPNTNFAPFCGKFSPISSTTSTELDDTLVEAGDNIC